MLLLLIKTDMPGRLDSSTSRIFCSTAKRRQRLMLVIISNFSLVTVVHLGVCLSPQAIPRVRLKRGLLYLKILNLFSDTDV